MSAPSRGPGIGTVIAVAAAALWPAGPGAQTSPPPDLLARSEKAYAALQSYADTGAVLYESGTDSVSRHAFKTYFRAPRHFYFDFTEDKKDGGDRLVLWGEGEDFQTWSAQTGAHSVYPKGRGRSAFMSADYPTNGVASVIASRLFPTAGLVTVMGELAEITAAGTEMVNGRQTQKLTGIARSMYGTGHVTNVRRVALWIDTDTLLIRKIFQDTPKGYGTPGTRLRITYTFEPQANPPLADAQFRFAPPERRQ